MCQGDKSLQKGGLGVIRTDGPILAPAAGMLSSPYSDMTHQRTLAIADDDELHAELVSAWLEHQGYRVLRFGSGDELVSWASSSAGEGVDALVLDVDMPGRDGFQSCRELRAIPAFASVPAVFVSAASPAQLATDECLRGSHFIRKDERMFVQLADWLSSHIYALD